MRINHQCPAAGWVGLTGDRASRPKVGNTQRMAGPFLGFPREAISFFKDLHANNEREWFQAHKDVYERACREPMLDLMAELGPQLGPSKISRINRDIRFSSDKSPYKTHIAAGVGRY